LSTTGWSGSSQRRSKKWCRCCDLRLHSFLWTFNQFAIADWSIATVTADFDVTFQEDLSLVRELEGIQSIVQNQGSPRISCACSFLPTSEQFAFPGATIAVRKLKASGVLGIVVFIIVSVAVLDDQVVFLEWILQVHQNRQSFTNLDAIGNWRDFWVCSDLDIHPTFNASSLRWNVNNFKHVNNKRLEVDGLLGGLAATASNSSGGVPGLGDCFVGLDDENVVDRSANRARSLASASIVWHSEGVDFVLSTSFDKSALWIRVVALRVDDAREHLFELDRHQHAGLGIAFHVDQLDVGMTCRGDRLMLGTRQRNQSVGFIDIVSGIVDVIKRFLCKGCCCLD